MDINKVIAELRERMADPLQKPLADKMIIRLKQVKKDETPIFGTMLYELLNQAERGHFKEGENDD